MCYYKDDWKETREWLTGWWRREVHGHWALGVIAPRAEHLKYEPVPPEPPDQRTRWLDADWNFKSTMKENATHFYGGCAFPYVTTSLGPGCLNLFLGSEGEFMPETVWYKPSITDPAKADLRLNPDNFYWQWVLRNTRDYVQRAKGLCPVAVPDLIEGLDVLSELMGTEELLAALIDCPQEVHRLLDQITDLYFKAFDPLAEIVRDDRGGNSFIAFNAWGPGRTLKSQCDFSAMISADMFAEFVCPYLERQCARVDFSTYHLDGPQAIHHLEHLVKVPSLTAIQWTPGFPNPTSADKIWWDKIWRKVYAAGKSAMVLSNPPKLIEPFLKEFGQKGTFITTRISSEKAARELIDKSADWGR